MGYIYHIFLPILNIFIHIYTYFHVYFYLFLHIYHIFLPISMYISTYFHVYFYLFLHIYHKSVAFYFRLPQKCVAFTTVYRYLPIFATKVWYFTTKICPSKMRDI